MFKNNFLPFKGTVNMGLLLCLALLVCGCAHSSGESHTSIIYQNLNTGEPTSTIIKAPYKDTYALARSVPSRQFVISENPPVEKPIEKALRFNFFDFKTGVFKNAKAIFPCSNKSLSINFAFNSCEIRHSEALALNNFIARLKHEGNCRVDITGYTDWIGSREYNRRLALKRARAVAKIFKSAGIGVGSITGKGKCCYIDSKNLGPNRRVEIIRETARKEVSKGR